MAFARSKMQTRPRRAFRAIAVGIAAMVVVSACSSSGSGTSTSGRSTDASSGDAGAKKPIPVSVYLSRSSVDWSFNVAKKLGYFEDEGLDVTIEGFDSGATASTAFRSAKGTFLQAGDLPSLSAISQGGVSLIANTNVVPKGILLITKASVTDPAHLKGRKIGAGLQSSAGAFIGQYLTDNNMTEKDVELINLSLNDSPAALIGGSVDAIVSYPSFATTLLEKSGGKYHILDAGLTANFTMVDETFAKGHPDAVVGFLRALDKAGKYIKTNTDDAAKIEAEADSITADVAKSWLDPQFGDVSSQPTFTEDDFRVLSRIGMWAVANGALAAMPDLCASADLTFMKKAAPSNGVAESCPSDLN